MNTLEFQDKLFETMKIFDEYAGKQSDRAKIIKCIVQKELSDGKYALLFQGNKIIAYDANPSFSNYQKGEIVYLLVEDGNLNSGKIILGRVTPRLLSPQEIFLSDEKGNKISLENYIKTQK